MSRSAPTHSTNGEVPRGPSGLRVAGGAALGLILVVVVAVLAAGSGGGDRDVSIPQVSTPTGWFDIVIGVLVMASIVGWGLIIVSAMAERGTPSKRPHPARTIPGMVLAGAVLWLGLTLYEPDIEPEVITAPTPTTTSTTEPGADTAEGSTDVDAGPILAGALLVVAAAVVVAWSIRRGRPGEEHREDHAVVRDRRDLLIGLLDDAIAELRAHPDPREAVIATWSRLEVAFEAVAVDRSPSDTPARYLSKVLGTVEASAPAVARLTATFERAMFSPDAIVRDDQLHAVDALVAVRDELNVLARRPTGSDVR